MKRVTAFGFWLGILCACIPLFMRGYGSYNQWQLRKAWDNRRAATHLAAARVTQEPTAADDLNWAQDSSATEAPSVATEDSSGDVNFSASKDAHAPETPAKAQDVSAPALHAARKVPGAAIAKTDGTNDINTCCIVLLDADERSRP